jgi:hypothetical protein
MIHRPPGVVNGFPPRIPDIGAPASAAGKTFANSAVALQLRWAAGQAFA